MLNGRIPTKAKKDFTAAARVNALFNSAMYSHNLRIESCLDEMMAEIEAGKADLEQLKAFEKNSA